MKSKYFVALLVGAIFFPFAAYFLLLTTSPESKGSGWLVERGALQVAAAEENCRFVVYSPPSVVAGLFGSEGEVIETIGSGGRAEESIKLLQPRRFSAFPKALQIVASRGGSQTCLEYSVRIALRGKSSLVVNQEAR